MKTPYIFACIHMVTASLLGWVGIVWVLVSDNASLLNILLCIGVSFVIAVPVAIILTKRVTVSNNEQQN